MNKVFKMMIILPIIGFVSVTFLINTKDVSALTVSDFVTGVSSLSATPGCGSSPSHLPGAQVFNVTLVWGAKCSSPYSCTVLHVKGDINNYPHCSSGTAQCPTAGDVTGISLSADGTSDGGKYEYYKFTLQTPKNWDSPTSTNHIQDVSGRIKRTMPEYKLTATAEDIDTGAALGCKIPEAKAFYDKTATVSRSNCNPSNYEWVKWSNKCGTGENCSKTLKSNVSVKAYYRRKVTLTAYAIDYSTNTPLNDGNPISTDTVLYGGSATGTKRAFAAPAGYSWKGWNVGGGSCSGSISEDCVVSPLKDDETIYAYFELNTFGGQSVLSGGASADTGISQESVSKTGFISDCSAKTGCSAVFNHYLHRLTGTGTTTYNIQRSSNLIVSTRAISGGTVVNDSSWDQTSNSLNQSSYTLYPGMIVCEWLNFEPYGGSGVKYTQVCASALGNAQPPDDPDPDKTENPNTPSGDESLVNIKVRNSNVAKYNKYMREVYAKPGYIDNDGNVKEGDLLYYRGTYYPWLQYTYYLKPNQFQINGGTKHDGDGQAISSLFQNNKGSLPAWNSAITIQYSSNNSASFSNLNPSHYSYTVGDFTGPKMPDPNSQRVTTSNVGSSINERIITNEVTASKTTPSQVTFTNNEGSNLANVQTAQKSRIAYARVPYNFSNTTKMNIPDDRIYHVGEAGVAETIIKVKPRRNNTTDGTYATYVKDAKWQLRVCYTVDGNNYCNQTAELSPSTDNTLNKNGDIQGSEDVKSIDFNVPDLPAGTEICLSTRVYPSDSGAETNWQNSSGSGAWSDWSESACRIVAKRPIIQVMGGNTYSGGSINTGLSYKKLLYSYNDNNDNNTDIKPHSNKPYTFGSWSELGLISRGSVSGFVSGASLGYVNNNNGNLTPVPYASILASSPNTRSNTGDNPGGSRESSICKLSPLTFANNCSGNQVGGTGGTDATSGISIDMDAIASLASSNISTSEITGDTILLDDTNSDGTETIIQTSPGNVTVQGGTLVRGSFKVIKAEGNIDITGDIQIADGESFETFRQAPKVVLYAKDKINIACNVTRLDALLVADTVITCNNLGAGDTLGKKIASNINNSQNSNQLVVNGAIVATRLYANRTYGAARGANSIVPAEIINFDPTLYLWGGAAGNDKEKGDNLNASLEQTYIHELAPRY